MKPTLANHFLAIATAVIVLLAVACAPAANTITKSDPINFAPAPNAVQSRTNLDLALTTTALTTSAVGSSVANPAFGTTNAPAALPAINWQRQVVDSRGFSGQSSDLALDSNGNWHVAYHYSGAGTILLYAQWDGVAWQKEVVDNTTLVSNQVSIMVDSQQRPHIAYQDASNQDLYYAFRDASGWRTTRVQHQGVVGRFNNIAFTKNGATITYFDETQGAIYEVSGGLENMTFTTPRKIGDTTTLEQHGLAADSEGNPHVTYHESVNGNLMLASKQINGSWSVETVADFSNVGVTSSLAFDSNDVPHITASVLYQGRYFLNYFYKSGSVWLEEGVAADVNLSLGRYHDLTLDNNDSPVVAYINSTNTNLLLARRDGANTWENETVDTYNVSRVGGVAVDAANNPVVSSYEFSFGDLVLHSGGDDWQTRTVYDNNAQPNYLPSLALNGHSPAVSFHTEATQPGSVQLAAWDGAVWADDIVGANADTAVSTPHVYNKFGQPYAAYYHSASREVRFASLVDNIWQTTPVVTLPAGTSIGPDLVLLLSGQAEYPTLLFSTYHATDGAELVLAQLVGGSWSQTAFPVAGQSAPPSPLAADYHYGGAIGIAYFDAANSTLDYALYNGQWFSEEVANGVQVTAVSTTVSRRRLENGNPINVPTVTYFNANSGQLMYARQEDVSTWIPYAAATPGSAVESLATVFIGNTSSRPRIAAITADNAVRLFRADDEPFSWVEETVLPADTAVRSHITLAFGDRERLAYLQDGVVMHTFRTATTQAPVTPAAPSSGFGGLQKSLCHCFIVASWCDVGGILTRRPDTAQQGVVGVDTAVAATALITDGETMDGLTQLFLATPEGTAFVNTYLTHDNELALILINDPVLAWDAFRTLENLMPGLGEFVQGRGAQVVIDQALMNQALDIWQRVAAEASPALAGIINQYLTDSNNLQDYVGMSFNEWAATLGVAPPDPLTVYLPFVQR